LNDVARSLIAWILRDIACMVNQMRCQIHAI